MHVYRKESHAPAAIQYIYLESGGCDTPFTAQKRALDNICEYAAVKLGADGEEDETREQLGSIMLKRRVFTKVRILRLTAAIR